MKKNLLWLFFLTSVFSVNAQYLDKTIKPTNLEEIQKALNNNLKDYIASDLDSWIIQSDASSNNKQAWYYYVSQTHNGIIVNNTVSTIYKENNDFKLINTSFVKGLESKINSVTPSLSASDAVLKALNHYKLSTANFDVAPVSKESDNDLIVFNRTSDLQSDIKVNLIYEPAQNGQVKLAWNVNLDKKDGSHWWNVRIDAVTGEYISDNDWVVSCNWSNEKAHNHKHNTTYSNEIDFTASVFNEGRRFMNSGGVYRVIPYYIESPNHGDFEVVTHPENAIASPNGWHDDVTTTYTTTRGNNVVARDDQNGNNGAGPLTSQSDPGLVFDYPYGGPAVAASTYIDAASTQLFYMSNSVHDIYYQYGFNEASGNFQVNNFSNGGTQGDAVNADVQDGSGTNNANFSTPPDGSSGRMQMYLWNFGAYDSDAVSLLVVNNTPVAGGYAAFNNAFNPGNVTPTSPITADLVLADDGTPDNNDACTDIVNTTEVNNNIAVIRRGDCTFISKALKAQDAGAIAVLIVNNVPGNINMSGADASLIIPTYSLNQSDGDAIIAQMATSTVNATFNPPTTPPPFVNIDGSFDNGVVAHEYGHGINIRLVGGRNNSGCVNANESMGEGWADFIGKIIALRNVDSGISLNGVGTFVVGQSPSGQGIRPAPYSGDISNNPMTYQTLIDDPTNATYTIPHGVGSVWAGMLWDLTWDLIAVHGFTPDIYNANGMFGNTIALNLVVEGMKLTSCNPGFVDGRDAILQADQNLYGGANQCIIWSAFARRGLGANASQGGNPSNPFDNGTSSTSDGNSDFTLPTGLGCNPNFLIDNADDASEQICQGSTTASFEFVFYEQNNFDTPTAFVASGLPAGASASFFPETMKDTGGFTMTISGIPAGTSGNFPITVVPGGDASKSKMVQLFINTSNPNLLDGDTVYSINAGAINTFDNNSTIAASSTDNINLTIPDTAFNGTVLWTAPNGDTYTTNTIGFTNIQDNDTSVEGNWTAQFSFTNDCGNSIAPQVINFNVDIDGLLGVNDFALEQVVLSPNPTNGHLTISGLTSVRDVKTSVIDIMGRVLSRNVSVSYASNNKIQIDMSQLSSGTYFVELISKGNKTVKKVIKN